MKSLIEKIKKRGKNLRIEHFIIGYVLALVLFGFLLLGLRDVIIPPIYDYIKESSLEKVKLTYSLLIEVEIGIALLIFIISMLVLRFKKRNNKKSQYIA